MMSDIQITQVVVEVETVGAQEITQLVIEADIAGSQEITQVVLEIEMTEARGSLTSYSLWW